MNRCDICRKRDRTVIGRYHMRRHLCDPCTKSVEDAVDTYMDLVTRESVAIILTDELKSLHNNK
jgi:hypothetical protein